jgi:hypothetical protein
MVRRRLPREHTIASSQRRRGRGLLPIGRCWGRTPGGSIVTRWNDGSLVPPPLVPAAGAQRDGGPERSCPPAVIARMAGRGRKSGLPSRASSLPPLLHTVLGCDVLRPRWSDGGVVSSGPLLYPARLHGQDCVLLPVHLVPREVGGGLASRPGRLRFPTQNSRGTGSVGSA